jgi:hypothetical protein
MTETSAITFSYSIEDEKSEYYFGTLTAERENIRFDIFMRCVATMMPKISCFVEADIGCRMRDELDEKWHILFPDKYLNSTEWQAPCSDDESFLWHFRFHKRHLKSVSYITSDIKEFLEFEEVE